MNDFIIKERISYADGNLFFKQYLKHLNFINIIYYCNLLVCSFVIIFYICKLANFGEIMTNLGFSLFAIIPFIFVHESIHLLAYILQGGGKNIRIGIKKGAFYSTCSKHIFSCKEYMFAALLPIVTISFFCLCVYMMCENFRGWLCIFYLIQLLASSTDVGIASYCYENINLYYVENHNSEEMFFLKRKEK